MSLLFPSACLFLCLAPFHSASFLQPIMWVHVMNSESLGWQLKTEKKQCHSKQPSHILYNKVAVSREEKRQRGLHRGFDCPLHLILWLLVWMFPRTHTWFFFCLSAATHLGPETERTSCQASLHFAGVGGVRTPQTPWGRVSQQPLYYVTAH